MANSANDSALTTVFASPAFVPAMKLGVSLLGHCVAFLYFHYRFAALGLPPQWYGQAVFSILLSFALSAATALFVRRRGVVFGLQLVRLLLLVVVGLPLGGDTQMAVALLTALVFETGLAFRFPADLAAAAVYIGTTLAMQFPVSSWGTARGTADVPTLLQIVYLPLVILMVVGLLKAASETAARQKTLLDGLGDAGLQLVDVNMKLQEYVAVLEDKAAEEERQRVANELHDTMGHRLTTIIMVVEAAIKVDGAGGEGLGDLLAQAREQAREGLDEIRQVLRLLKAKPATRATLVTSLKRLADAFAHTHVRLRVEYGNVPWSFGDEMDRAVYRIVQEGVTNAIRHGGAGTITVYLWIDGGRMHVTVKDDGRGGEIAATGLGLDSMRERAAHLGGTVRFLSAADGFTVLCEIPWTPPEERAG